MTMREIQDLTLDLARGAERLDTVFRERAAGFSEWLSRATGDNGACRITAFPLGSFPGLPRLSGDVPHFPFKTVFRASYGGSEVELAGISTGGIRPIVRNIRFYEHNDSARLDVSELGLVDLWFRQEPRSDGCHFRLGWLLGAYLSVLDAVDRMRLISGVPEWEFAVETALDGLSGAPRAGGGRVPLSAILLGGFGYSPWTANIGEIPVLFPRIAYRTPDDREIILNAVLEDLLDATGEFGRKSRLTLIE
jgi:hypothetical protein